MPSINRLVLLAALSLSVYVHSAPVRNDAGAELARAIVVTERDVVAAREPEFDTDVVARFVDDDLEEREFDEDIEARAAKKKVAPKPVKKVAPKPVAKKVAPKPVAKKVAPKPVAKKVAPKPVAKKVVAKPAAKKVVAKPAAKKVVAKPAAKKVAAKPAAKAPAKTTTKAPAKAPVKAPAKTTTKAPVKAPAKAPAKTTKAPTKAPAKAPAKTTKAPAKTSAKSCPIKKPATKAATKPAAKKTKVARAYEYIAHLFERDNQEFIGWHGTNSDTAAFWAQKGQLEKPVKADGLLDFIGLGPKSTGTSGADAEIGPGVYVTDDQDIAIAFANNNAKVNPGTTAQLCAIFAKSSANWRTVIRKAFIPENLVGDSSSATKKATLENARLAHIKTAVPGVSATSVVKLSLLNRITHTGQLVLPASITNQFTAQCFKADGGAAAAGTSKFPAFTYNGNTLRTEWKVAAETAGATEECT